MRYEWIHLSVIQLLLEVWILLWFQSIFCFCCFLQEISDCFLRSIRSHHFRQLMSFSCKGIFTRMNESFCFSFQFVFLLKFYFSLALVICFPLAFLALSTYGGKGRKNYFHYRFAVARIAKAQQLQRRSKKISPTHTSAATERSESFEPQEKVFSSRFYPSWSA